MTKYKDISISRHELLLSAFLNSIEDDVKSTFCLDCGIKDNEISYDDALEFVNSNILPIYTNFQNYPSYLNDDNIATIVKILNYLLIILDHDGTDINYVQTYCVGEFVCWLLQTRDEDQIVYNSFKVFSMLFKIQINDTFIDYFFCTFRHLSSQNPYILEILINLIGYLFNFNFNIAVKLINHEDVMNAIFYLAQNNQGDLICSQTLLFFCSLLYHAINDCNFLCYVSGYVVEKIIDLTFPFLQKYKQNITPNALKVLQVISTSPDMLPIALRKGMENQILLALNELPKKQTIILFTIIQNLFFYASQNERTLKIVEQAAFYVKIAELLQNSKPKNISIILSLIDHFGDNFYSMLAKYNVLDSMCSILQQCDYDNKKHICSILLKIFKIPCCSFRRDYCKPNIVEEFVSFLEEDDTSFRNELIGLLATMLSDDPEYFQPLLMNFEFERCLERLAENENSELSSSIEVIYKYLPLPTLNDC